MVTKFLTLVLVLNFTPALAQGSQSDEAHLKIRQLLGLKSEKGKPAEDILYYTGNNCRVMIISTLDENSSPQELYVEIKANGSYLRYVSIKTPEASAYNHQNNKIIIQDTLKADLENYYRRGIVSRSEFRAQEKNPDFLKSFPPKIDQSLEATFRKGISDVTVKVNDKTSQCSNLRFSRGLE